MTEAITIDWEGKVGVASGGKDNKEEGFAAASGGGGAVDDASNVHEVFGRRPDRESEDRRGKLALRASYFSV